MKTFIIYIFFTVVVLFYPTEIIAKNTWFLDKKLSEIKFELPILLVKDVKGKFNQLDGYIVIDKKKNIKNNKALFSVQINSIEMNYNKYKKILFSKIFFDEENFPISLLHTKQFTLPINSDSLLIEAELQIKDIIHIIPFKIKMIHLTNNLLQIKADAEFSRTSYELGKGNWASTLMLSDKIKLKANLFLNRTIDN